MRDDQDKETLPTDEYEGKQDTGTTPLESTTSTSIIASVLIPDPNLGSDRFTPEQFLQIFQGALQGEMASFAQFYKYLFEDCIIISKASSFRLKYIIDKTEQIIRLPEFSKLPQVLRGNVLTVQGCYYHRDHNYLEARSALNAGMQFKNSWAMILVAREYRDLNLNINPVKLFEAGCIAKYMGNACASEEVSRRGGV